MSAEPDSFTAALQSVRHPLSTSRTLPPACYHGEAWLDKEIETVFRNGWVYVGRQDQWPNSGDFEAMNLCGVPLVITRDGDGHLHALSNTCLHRSSEVASGRGNSKALVCPFHGWSYDHCGNLLSAPRMESAEGFVESENRLPEFTLAESDGFVFIHLGSEPEPLEYWLEDFSDLHIPWSLGSLVTTRSRSFNVNCNWKLFLEVFNEYYHLPYVHGKSINHYYPEPDPSDPVMGQFTTQFGLTSANPALLDDSQDAGFPHIGSLQGRDAEGTRYTWVYPNLTFAASVDCIWIYHVYPLTARTCRAVQTICFPPETVARDDFEQNAAEYYYRFDVAIDEDIPALEKQQQGMESPFAAQGRFSTLEPSVGNFACWYAALLGSER